MTEKISMFINHNQTLISVYSTIEIAREIESDVESKEEVFLIMKMKRIWIVMMKRIPEMIKINASFNMFKLVYLRTKYFKHEI